MERKVVKRFVKQMQVSTAGTCATTEWFAISLDHTNEEMMISTPSSGPKRV